MTDPLTDPLTDNTRAALDQMHGYAIGLKARLQWGGNVTQEDLPALALMVRNLIVVVEDLATRVAALEPGKR